MTIHSLEVLQAELVNAENKKEKDIKCIVWDLDNTIWKGTLLEGDILTLQENIREILFELDQRGILMSISSKNEYDLAIKQLEEFGIAEYFLYPQINWNSKSESIKKIAESLNIGLNTFAFIDDQEYEREEVKFSLPEVLTVSESEINNILSMKRFDPKYVTTDSKLRRKMYQADIKRNEIEKEFSGPQEEFLASLEMVLTVTPADKDDLRRAEELTVRTNQLNATGYTYSYEELDFFRVSPDHILLIAGLEDKFGTYGKIGLTLIEKKDQIWNLKLLLMSCRVMSRGIGTVYVNLIREMAKNSNVKLLAEMIQNERNRMMYMTYKFQNFNEISQDGNFIVFENDLSVIPPRPSYLKIITRVL